MNAVPSVLAGNWKMNHGPAASLGFFEAWAPLISKLDPKPNPAKAQVELYVPALSLAGSLEGRAELENRTGLRVAIGVQNAHAALSGAFTGELSGPMLLETGIRHALIGHSERRQHFGETDASALERTHSLLKQGFEVILCVGETRVERDQGRERERVGAQLLGIETWADVVPGRLKIAYEPVWAIGTGVVAKPEDIEEMHTFLRDRIHKAWGEPAGSKIPLLYGGSVTPENFPAILGCSEVNGALVGGASLQPEKFTALLQQILA